MQPDQHIKLEFSYLSLEFIHICQLQAFPHPSAITASPVIRNNQASRAALEVTTKQLDATWYVLYLTHATD